MVFKGISCSPIEEPKDLEGSSSSKSASDSEDSSEDYSSSYESSSEEYSDTEYSDSDSSEKEAREEIAGSKNPRKLAINWKENEAARVAKEVGDEMLHLVRMTGIAEKTKSGVKKLQHKLQEEREKRGNKDAKEVAKESWGWITAKTKSALKKTLEGTKNYIKDLNDEFGPKRKNYSDSDSSDSEDSEYSYYSDYSEDTDQEVKGKSGVEKGMAEEVAVEEVAKEETAVEEVAKEETAVEEVAKEEIAVEEDPNEP